METTEVRPRKDKDSIALDRSKLKKPGKLAGGRLVLWIAPAATTVVGVVFLYQGPSRCLVASVRRACPKGRAGVPAGGERQASPCRSYSGRHSTVQRPSAEE